MRDPPLLTPTSRTTESPAQSSHGELSCDSCHRSVQRSECPSSKFTAQLVPVLVVSRNEPDDLIFASHFCEVLSQASQLHAPPLAELTTHVGHDSLDSQIARVRRVGKTIAVIEVCCKEIITDGGDRYTCRIPVACQICNN